MPENEIWSVKRIQQEKYFSSKITKKMRQGDYNHGQNIWVLSCSRSATHGATYIYQFITNNHASFHLCWKENLLNHQVSKYSEHYCLQNFLLLFMSLLTTVIVKNNHILTGIYLIFLKNRPRPNLKGFQYWIWTSLKR